MKRSLLIVLFIFIILIINNFIVQAQSPPAINYTTPQNYLVDSVITPLSPVISGGAVFPSSYNATSVFASYNTPFSIAIDGSNNVYTTNNSTGDLTKYSSAGKVLFTVNTGDIQASEVAVDGLGNIYVAQFTANSVLKYNSSGTFVGIITGFSDPYGIAFDLLNNAYVVNYFSGNILKINAGATSASVYLTGFNKPYGIAIDAAGNMYVGEQGPGDIIKVAAGTLARTTFASGFNNPRHLNKDQYGNIYVADYGNNAIKGISPAGNITNVLSSGLSSPRQAAFDSSGNLFIANYGTNALLKASPSIFLTNYSISAPLPAGLNFNTATGQITGTPTAPAATATYTIKAYYNTGATSSAAVTITVKLSSNAALANLTLTNGSLTPGFASATTSYTASVANNTSSVTVTPVTSDPGATVTVNGTKVASGAASASLPLNVGNNTITTIVTAPDGTTRQSYTIIVTRAALSTVILSGLALSSGSLSPSFSSWTGSYIASVANNINSITVTPTTNNATESVTVNGVAVASGSVSASMPLNVGGNTIATVVTNQAGTITQQYVITVIRAGSSSAILAGLALSSGTLNPSFSSATGTYTANVANNVSSITLTPTTADSTTTVTVNDTTVVSGMASQNLPLNVGSNTITTIVTAQDGVTTQSYIVTVNRAPSSIATLAGLNLSSGSLSPAFSSTSKNYTASVANNISTIALTPITNDSTQTVTINGAPVTSDSTSAGLPLIVGSNKIITVVTAQDGINSTSYVLTVTRAPSSNAAIDSLALNNAGSNTPFSSGTGSYTVNVANSVTSITMRPTTSDATATVTVNGATIPAGALSAPIALIVGNNIITTVVTAQDKTTKKTYTVTVIRAPSSNAGLSNISSNTGSLSPGFSTGTNSYTINVGNLVTSITVKPVTSDATATIAVNGAALPSGSFSSPVALKVGNNPITIVVTAQDKTTKNTYTITVIRAPSAVAWLSSLKITNVSLTPGFATAITSYTTSLRNAATSAIFTMTTTDATATLTINGTPITSGMASAPIALKVGNNTITVVVTAQDNTTKNTYTVVITRAPSSNPVLANMVVSSGSLTPAFAAGVTTYTVNVGNTITSLTLTPTPSDATATVTVNGTPVTGNGTSAPVALAVGNNTITTVVTAQDKVTTDTYIVVAIRAPSANAGLSSLSFGGGKLTPVFATGTTNYTVSATNATTSVTVRPVTSDATATVTVNGTTLTGGVASAPIALKVGNTIITTIVTAQDKKTKTTYTITVARPPASNVSLSNLVVSSGGLNPAFTTATTNYTANVSNSAGSITVTPTTTNTAATIAVNGLNVASGSPSPSLPLTAGNNTINIIVSTTTQGVTTAQSYYITVIKAGSSNAALAGLSLSSGSLSPVFASGTLSYTDSVTNGIDSVTVTPVTSDAKATVMVNGTTVVSSSASAILPLNVGDNTITTVVTAQDGVTTESYIVTVNRGAASGSATVSPNFVNNRLTQGYSSANEGNQKTGADRILVHKAVSPNGDGINDFLLIEGIEDFPNNKVTIVNSVGTTVYNTQGYNNFDKAFDGHSNINGSLQPPGTYFYLIEYTINGKVQRKTGYFILKFV